MGDPARFRLFARTVQRHFPAPGAIIADVASGRGALQSELRQLGYTRVTSWDRRRRNAGGRPCYRYGLFDWREATDYDLVLGMHPDEATDQIVRYAGERRVPFVVCPCCVLPSASSYAGKDYEGWFWHLHALAKADGMRVAVDNLPMRGRNRLLIGWPD